MPKPDPRLSSPRRTLYDMFRTIGSIVSTTPLCRCWPVLILTGAWSSAICILNHYTDGKLSIQPTLITVFGTVLGFVISFRTTSSFDRYNDGRKYWSQIVFNCRIFSRTVWFHMPDNAIFAPDEAHPISDEDKQRYEAMTLIEKKTAINLLLGYAVALKHYLRGEDGTCYQDLYPIVSYLDPCYYRFPAIIPPTDAVLPRSTCIHHLTNEVASTEPIIRSPESQFASSGVLNARWPLSRSTKSKRGTFETSKWTDVESQTSQDLLPAELPPKYFWLSAVPFHLLHRAWRFLRKDDTHQRHRCNNNVPLEISIYLTSYISTLQARNVLHDTTLNTLCGSLDQLVDALTELERIIVTPIPASYSIHLWLIATLYCGTLPFQTWSSIKWFTIPASVIASLVFFGFIVAGEEIENPFGYDKNDLDMGAFVENIIRKELCAITAKPPPNPMEWAFAPNNDFLWNSSAPKETPSAWLAKGKAEILEALYKDDRKTTKTQ